MSETHTPHPENQPTTPYYEEHDMDHATRRVSVRRSSGEIDAGWIEIGQGVNSKGKEFTRVMKMTEAGIMEKDVDTAALNELNERLASEEHSKRQMGGRALEAVGVPSFIIDRVPGIDRQVLVEAEPVRHGQRIRVERVSNPSRVIGHPSNPTTDMSRAYVESFAAPPEKHHLEDRLGTLPDRRQ